MSSSISATRSPTARPCRRQVSPATAPRACTSGSSCRSASMTWRSACGIPHGPMDSTISAPAASRLGPTRCSSSTSAPTAAASSSGEAQAMALLQWKAQYSVGIAAVDHEHRELIDLINRLHDGLARGDATSTEGFFGDLFRGISAHFALEERFMRDHHYDQVVQHKADHE